jgi:membrane-bound metal-dependent hydrolase YbcI (DUF457 family)
MSTARTGALSGHLAYALKDEAIHFSFGMLVNVPLLLLHGAHLIVPIFIFAVLIDLDHAIAAWSFSVRRMLSLSARPPGHSISFALIAGLSVFLMSGTPVHAWVAFSSVVSHILVDSGYGGGTPILWPFADRVRVTDLQRTLGITLLLVGSAALAVMTA